jgi:hypothetical protein
MTRPFTQLLTLGSILGLRTAPNFLRASDMHERVQSVTQILSDKQYSDDPIPADLLSYAKRVAIFSITNEGKA